MTMFNRSTLKYDPKGEAIRREKMRNADLDREERNKSFPTIFIKRYGFRPYYTGHDTIQIKGPLCPSSLTKERQCLAPLFGDSENATKAHCNVCEKSYEMPHSFQKFREIAHAAYEGLLNSQTDLITLDVPYEAVKAEAEDSTRKIKIVWSQKDGRNQAVIYLIKKDDKGDKSQIFVDLDREEIRYDPNNIPPGKILSKIKAVFKNTNIDIEFKEENKKEP